MGSTYRTKDGYTVEVVQLSDTSGNHDGEWLRVRYHGYHVADVRSVAELERYFPLGELEADALARRRPLDRAVAVAVQQSDGAWPHAVRGGRRRRSGSSS